MLSQQTFCNAHFFSIQVTYICAVCFQAWKWLISLVLHSWESRSWTLTHILDFSHAQCLKIPKKNYIFTCQFWTYFWRTYQIIDFGTHFKPIFDAFLTFFTNSWRFWTDFGPIWDCPFLLIFLQIFEFSCQNDQNYNFTLQILIMIMIFSAKIQILLIWFALFTLV